MPKLKDNDYFLCPMCGSLNGLYLESTSYPHDGHFTYYRPINDEGRWLFGMKRTNEKALCRSCQQHQITISNPDAWRSGMDNLRAKADKSIIVAFSCKALGVETSKLKTKIADTFVAAALILRGDRDE